ncbi:MAG: hypothetical protein EOO88_49365 [Pedobacter sp.]|nr:MAG: hypothetical protein EOO88_49365 [Pedobacter sp.]
MGIEQLSFLTLAILVVAFLYSSVGHAGASGYIAVMSLFGLAPAVIKPTALILNILVACIGAWHYDRRIYDNHHYKSAKTVIHTLADVVSKNGNLLLNIPLRGDGSIDSDGLKVVTEIGEWMNVNKEAIIGTRPWKKFGEGPAIENAAPLSAQGFNEGKGKPFAASDIRFTTKGKVLYAIPMGWPEDGQLVIKSLGSDNPALSRINSITLLGHGAIKNFSRDAEGLKITLPTGKPALTYAYVLKIS